MTLRVGLVGLLLLASCGTTPPGSCQQVVTGVTICVEYIGSDYTAGSARSACEGQGGTYSTGTCAPNAQGTCEFGAGTPTEHTWTLSGSTGLGSMSFESACEAAGGTFSS